MMHYNSSNSKDVNVGDSGDIIIDNLCQMSYCETYCQRHVYVLDLAIRMQKEQKRHSHYNDDMSFISDD